MSGATTLRSQRSPGTITRRPMARHGLSADGRWLHIGTDSIDLSKVASFKSVGLSEKDLSTGFATIAIFSAVSAVMIFLVVETGWRAKFLLEGVLFGAIAMCAIGEIFSSRRRTLFTFELTLNDGQHHTFVTALRNEAEQVQAALVAVGAQIN